MRLRLFLAGLFVCAASRALMATEPAVYDLATCIRAALKTSPDLMAIAADLAGARARLSEAQAGRFGRSEYTQVVGLVNEARGDPVFSPDGKNDVFSGLGPFTRIDLDINIPLWTFGKLSAALRAGQQALEGERARREVKRAEVVLRTKQLYYGLLLAEQLSEVLRDMLDTMDKAVATTQERLDAGSSAVSELDLLKLKTGRAKFAKGVLVVEASTRFTRSALARETGQPAGSDFRIADRKLTPVEANIAPLPVYLLKGPARRPELRRLLSGMAAQSAKVALEEASYYPTLFLSTGLQFARAGNRTEQSNPFAEDDFNFIRPVGVLGMRWDLNFLTTRAKVAQARAELESLRAQQREAATGLDLEIRRAYSNVLRARDTIAAAKEGRKAGRALLILTVANFDMAIGEAEELFDGLGAYTEASTNYFRAVHDYNVAVATLSKAVGDEVTPLRY
ncbi:MAG: TolC family protein [Candidatus Binatia bacterium]